MPFATGGTVLPRLAFRRPRTMERDDWPAWIDFGAFRFAGRAWTSIGGSDVAPDIGAVV
ncbi:hypothetical protein [Bradyrhizobium sp. SK17]|uniref:hypothetical protein n=1 Tax=Bradyrhizobium sp. SK17 TaxID=2057741 RepID=UPI0012FE049F|nr:hypothetical protein [Bradyrhizobium sp. SK17]